MRKNGGVSEDDNYAAAERFSEMMDGDYSFYQPIAQDGFNFGQFFTKVFRARYMSNKGNGSLESDFVASWGALGAFNREQGVGWVEWRKRNCACE